MGRVNWLVGVVLGFVGSLALTVARHPGVAPLFEVAVLRPDS
jgi:hypothetical protein